VLLQILIGLVDDGDILQILFPDHLHSQLLRKTVDSRAQGNEGGKHNYNRRDEEDDADERENPYGNQMFVVPRLHTITTPEYSAGS